MNFQQLRHFIVTASCGNILKAAEIVNITQSGLSRSINALEASLGLPLFERGPKGVKLTEFGEDLVPFANRLLNEHDRALENLSAFRRLDRGSLTIGVAHSFAYYVAPEAISSVLRQWPGVELSIVSDNYQRLQERMLDGELDFAFSLYTGGSRHPDLDYEDLFTVNTRVFARTGHELTTPPTVSAEQIAACHWGLINGASAQTAFFKYFNDRGIEPPKISLRCASIAMLVSVVQDTDLITILPEELISTDTHLRLSPINIGDDDVFGSAYCGLIFRKSMVELPVATQFADAVRREIRLLAKAPPPGQE